MEKLVENENDYKNRQLRNTYQDIKNIRNGYVSNQAPVFKNKTGK